VVPYQIDLCAYCKTPTWCEKRQNGHWQCRGCKIVNFFRWMYRHIGYSLLDWQEKELRALYGTVDPDTGARRYQRGYIEIPKKNGKTFLVGGLPIYHLVAEDERKPEAYGAAATKEQAGLVFKAAVELIENNPDLSARLRILKSVKRIVQRRGSGFYQVLSSDGKGASGVEPSLLLLDEIHRFTGAKAETLWAELWKGQISRPESLGVMTTTAGAEDESLIWNEERDFAKSVIAGETESNAYYASIYQADETRVREEPEYFKTREARVTANPSHEDRGGFLKDSKILEELEKALKKTGGINDYLRYHLGIKLTSTQENAIDMGQWIHSGGEVDLRTWPEYDAALLYRKWGLVEKPAVIGIDASWSIDLSAVSIVFPPAQQSGSWHAMLFFWMPEAKIKERETKDNVPYGQWVKKGFITACPGNAIDYNSIKERIRWACKMFDVAEVGYDKWNFRATAMDLLDEGVPMVEVPQNFAQLSEPTKTMIGAYQDARFIHGNNPVLNFNARCLALQYDRKDNVQPAKPERLKSKKRIDGIAATLTGVSRGLHMVQTGPSSWENAATAVM
jgi:phage terminase large subunit-like protein